MYFLCMRLEKVGGRMYKLCFYVPNTHLEEVKEALFNLGVGRMGNYDHCCWQAKGVGQFKALKESNPFVGEINKIEILEEYKVEMICQDNLIKDAVKMLRQAHPYEEPAIDVWKMDDILSSQ